VAKKRIKANQQKGKRITATPQLRDVAPEQQSPLFSLFHLQKGYSLSDCTKAEKAAFADTLLRLSQLTWNEMGSSPRHGLGYERIQRDAIRSSIPIHIKEDVNFIAFRFCGKAPMVGYRDGNIFHVLWLDRAYSLYDHG
jgi:hypothetical protein